MANKFLPFIVEKSTPINIYQTLLSRSKGMNTTLIASVLYLVLKNGITDVRAYVKTLEEMSLEALYNELVNHYPNSRIPDGELREFEAISQYLTDADKKQWATELNEFELKDILNFFFVVAKIGSLKEVTELPFDQIFERADIVLENLSNYIKFSDSGTRTEFKTKLDLKAYIFYRVILIDDTPEVPICAVFRKQGAPDASNPF